MAMSSRKRALWTGGLMALGFTAFSLRLIDLQLCQHDAYTVKADEKHSTKQIAPARRGDITDRNGIVLATSEPVKTVIVDASVSKRHDALAELLSRHLKMPYAEVSEKISRTVWSDKEQGFVPSPFIVIQKEVSEVVADGIRKELDEKHLRGVSMQQDFIRIYPNNSMLCHVVGFMNREGTGVEGVEKSMDEFLAGHPGVRFTERDRSGREIPAFRKMERPPRHGDSVRLTVDLALQDIVETEMDAAVRQFRPKMATCILMRPSTGEILALANRPHFDVNQRSGVPDEARKNRAIMDMVEPGSTFKLVTTAAALDCKLVKPETGIYCEHGKFTYAGTTLHDSHHGFGELSVHDILVKSSNIGVAKLGIMLGENRLHSYIKNFGFGERTGISLPGEIRGTVHDIKRWSKISITHVPMGHEVGATPMQVISAMCTVANRGRMVQPQIISSLVDDEGGTRAIYPPVEVRRVVPEDVAEHMVSALKEVVSKKGTAARAHVPGFEVAGKTGTAQKTAPGGGYEHGKYVVSFVGFLPADKPELCCLVLIDDARTGTIPNYGGHVSAPVFSRIATRVARHLNLTPNPDLMKVPNPLARAAEKGGR
jgi:cell division protein FtsI (penicillin-binding protein 3)/stage V sporulation protein D (sporulation-specific penicillin-binding protein)